MGKEIYNYIAKHIKSGHPADKIRDKLVSVGHDSDKVDEEINHVEQNMLLKKVGLLFTVFIVLVALIFIISSPSETEMLSPAIDCNSRCSGDTECITICQDDLMFEAALNGGDAKYCSKIKDSEYRDECLSLVR